LEGLGVIRARDARKIATAAAYGGGGLGLAGSALYGLLLAEAKLARRWVGPGDLDPPACDGLYGSGRRATIRLVMLGDSSAAGLGVSDPHETPGALLAAGLSAVAERRVRLTGFAKVGAQSSNLDDQITRALAVRPHIALIMIGANDVTHRVRPSVSVRRLQQAVRRLREAGVEVVVGTCPDLGTVEPIAQPLRWVARHWSRQLAAAQTIAVVEAGGRTVSLGDLLGPEFHARPSEMFGPDRFHPSALGYAAAAMAMLPSVCAALGYWPTDDEETGQVTGEGVLPVALAAVEAVDAAGTEVAGTQVGGRERGPRGRWALLRRRRRPVPDVLITAEEATSSAQPTVATAVRAAST
jgi:lysophospholipase L1-like esterase